jgi:Fe2+ transport system protein B
MSKLANSYPARWLAIKLLEEDEEVIRKFQKSTHLNSKGNIDKFMEVQCG